uniref:protein-tyrosine-phosphatase n=1 Tax=Panagrellus redivivus TaxID=6233 RepID=A0A7E4ZS92_PANRE
MEPVQSEFCSFGLFYHNVTGDRAGEILTEYGQPGDFLVRPSESNRNEYTLSVHRGGQPQPRITHVKIPVKDNAFYLPNGKTFTTLAALVEDMCDGSAFKSADGHLIEMKRPLVIPAYDKSVLNGCDRFFHPMIDGKDAEQLLEREPNGSFLLRESTSNPREFVLCAKTGDTVLQIKIENFRGKFRINDQTESFRTIPELISTFSKRPMFQQKEGAIPVALKKEVPSQRVYPDMIESRMKYLEGNTNQLHYDQEFNELELDPELRMFTSVKESRNPEYLMYNRFKNVIPLDHSRVKLKHENSNFRGNDYINANYIGINQEKYPELQGFTKKYIATQACLDTTVENFWRMVWQEKCPIIVMLTQEYERNKAKCVKYWPDYEHTKSFPCMLTVKNVGEEGDEKFVSRIFEVTRGGETRTVLHYQLLFWDDYDVPTDSVQIYMEKINAVYDSLVDPGSMIIHCHAGIGRTGTYIALDILMNVLNKRGLNWPISVYRVVYMLRESRARMVQNEHQYRFIYETILEYIKAMKRDSSTSSGSQDSSLLTTDSGGSMPCISPRSPLTSTNTNTSPQQRKDSETFANTQNQDPIALQPPPLPARPTTRAPLPTPVPTSADNDYVNTSTVNQ